MEKLIFDKIIELAKLLQFKKINDKYFEGRGGTIFKMTRYGFEVASIMAEDYPQDYTTCENY